MSLAHAAEIIANHGTELPKSCFAMAIDSSFLVKNVPLEIYRLSSFAWNTSANKTEVVDHKAWTRTKLSAYMAKTIFGHRPDTMLAAWDELPYAANYEVAKSAGQLVDVLGRLMIDAKYTTLIRTSPRHVDTLRLEADNFVLLLSSGEMAGGFRNFSQLFEAFKMPPCSSYPSNSKEFVALQFFPPESEAILL